MELPLSQPPKRAPPLSVSNLPRFSCFQKHNFLDTNKQTQREEKMLSTQNVEAKKLHKIAKVLFAYALHCLPCPSVNQQPAGETPIHTQNTCP